MESVIMITLPCQPPWLAGCNAEGTKCVNFPNLQQQFVAAIQSESQSMHNAAHELRGQ